MFHRKFLSQSAQPLVADSCTTLRRACTLLKYLHASNPQAMNNNKNNNKGLLAKEPDGDYIEVASIPFLAID